MRWLHGGIVDFKIDLNYLTDNLRSSNDHNLKNEVVLHKLISHSIHSLIKLPEACPTITRRSLILITLTYCTMIAWESGRKCTMAWDCASFGYAFTRWMSWSLPVESSAWTFWLWLDLALTYPVYFVCAIPTLVGYRLDWCARTRKREMDDYIIHPAPAVRLS